MTEVAQPLGDVRVENIKLQIDMPSPTDSGFVSKDPSPTSETVPETVTQSQPEPAPVNGNVTTHKMGPDTIFETYNIFTCSRSEGVKLRTEPTGCLSEPSISVVTLLRNTVAKCPNNKAIGVKRDGKWVSWTYQQYMDDVVTAGKAFIKLGLEPYHGVGIIGFNSPEWFISDIAAIFAGGFAVGIYTTNNPEACKFVAENCEANIIVAENKQQLSKILKIRSELPHLKAIIQYTGELDEKYPDVYTWDEFMSIGREANQDQLDERISGLAPNKCCTLIYTSGTTGKPKGVMLSHDNITWTAKTGSQMARLKFGEEHSVSYLPLSHIAAQMLDIYMPILTGSAVWFAQPDALKGSLSETLKEVRPTTFFGVPRVWEKMQEKITALGKGGGAFKKKIARWAKGVGLKGNLSLMKGGTLPTGWSIANALVFKKVRAGLGMDRCRICLTGAAPIMKDTLDFFMSLNLPLMELYGMSESTGPHTISFPWRYQVTSVGTEFPGASTKLDNPDKDGNGEVCMGGRHVFMGYLNAEEKTQEAIDAEGYLRTGDVGRKSKEGFLYITGRIKELIITAGGENIAPVPIEDILKEELACVSNCMLIGDKRKFLSMLITLKTHIDGETNEPLDALAPTAIDWCKEVGSTSNSVSRLLDSRDEKALKAIQAGVDRANKRAVSRAAVIQKWSILPRDFSIPGGELGPTLKLKRPVVMNMYQNTIEAFYTDS